MRNKTVYTHCACEELVGSVVRGCPIIRRMRTAVAVRGVRPRRALCHPVWEMYDGRYGLNTVR